jgi:hypothetical protein
MGDADGAAAGHFLFPAVMHPRPAGFSFVQGEAVGHPNPFEPEDLLLALGGPPSAW